jgi:hypothetical protein
MADAFDNCGWVQPKASLVIANDRSHTKEMEEVEEYWEIVSSGMVKLSTYLAKFLEIRLRQ